MNIWYDYRAAWVRKPWLAAVALLAVAMIVAGIIGTIVQNLVLILFIPGLIVLYGHHLLVGRIE